MADHPSTPPPSGSQGPNRPQSPDGGQQGRGNSPQGPHGPQQGFPQQRQQGYPQQWVQSYGPPGAAPPGAGMPPNPPQQPPPRRPRRTGLIVGGIAAASVLLLVAGGVVAWVIATPDDPYAALPSCSALVTDEVTEITGQHSSEIDEQVIGPEELGESVHSDVEEVVQCDPASGYAGDEYLAVSAFRFSAGTVDGDYATVHDEAVRMMNDESGPFEDPGPTPEDVSVGDGGYQLVTEFEQEAESFYGEGDSVSIVLFADRNAIVSVWYRAPSQVSDDEKRDISLRAADALVRTLQEVAEVEA